jgi:predicted CXXCH cytochrome family protein
MYALLRQLRRGPNGADEYADTEVNSDSITIGSAANRDIQLIGRGVAADHALIRRSGRTLTITGRARARFTVNGGRAKSAAALESGDVLDIGGNHITVLEPPAGFDLALAIQLNTDIEKSEFESAFKTELEQTWLSKRRTSWTLLVLTGLLAFGLPLATAVLHRDNMTTAAWVPDDTFWSAGPLSPAHAQAAGRRCEACHRQFFVPSRDQECRKCHDKIRDHVPAADLRLTQLGAPSRCGVCHEEHNAPGGSIVIRSDAFCVACHADSHARFGSLHVDSVSGFSEKNHPQFKATVLIAAVNAAGADAGGAQPSAAPHMDATLAATIATGLVGSALIDWKPLRVSLSSGEEHSNLKYSHAEHLDINKVQRASDSKALGCADCHRLAADGEHFAPITMANACSACHELTFDDKAPDRQLPHGKPRDSMLMIEDYYARKFSDPEKPATESARRRVPDNALMDETCTGSPFACGMRRAALEITNQFTRRGCVSCHVVTDNRAADVHARFEVLPVRLVRDYFPDTHFNHRLHAVQKDLTGDAACLSCHKARDSTDSRKLLLPSIGKCLECHGDASPTMTRVTLQCVSCHAYHSQP